jgi:hypothetical protein
MQARPQSAAGPARTDQPDADRVERGVGPTTRSDSFIQVGQVALDRGHAQRQGCRFFGQCLLSKTRPQPQQSKLECEASPAACRSGTAAV